MPGAKRDAVAGWLGEALKIRVSAPPEKGKANHAVLRVLAEALGVDVRAVQLESGATSRRKRVAIEGLDEADVRARIARWLERSS